MMNGGDLYELAKNLGHAQNDWALRETSRASGTLPGLHIARKLWKLRGSDFGGTGRQNRLIVPTPQDYVFGYC